MAAPNEHEAAERVVASSEQELIAAVEAADAAGVELRIGASPQADEGFSGRLIQVTSRGLTLTDDGCEADSLAYCGGMLVTVGAGMSWPEFVALAVESEWVGVERLAWYQGSVAGATIANVHAYGQSVSDTIAAVRTYDRVARELRRFAMVYCEFERAGSRFSRERMPDGSPRYVLLDIAFLLVQGDLTEQVTDPGLASLLNVELWQRATLRRTRDAVLAAMRDQDPAPHLR